MIEVALGRISWTLSRRTVVDFALVSVTSNRVGALGADDAGEHLAVPGRDGIGGVIGLDHRARGRDASINVGPALAGDAR